jgi:hypothetical protein
VGITWLGPPVGAFFLWRLREEGRGVRALLWSLLLFALPVRAAVAGLMTVATLRRLGTHYDLSRIVTVRTPFTGEPAAFLPGSWEQVLVLGVAPQLTFWVAFTVVTGLVGAILFGLASSLGGPQRLSARMAQMGTRPAA